MSENDDLDINLAEKGLAGATDGPTETRVYDTLSFEVPADQFPPSSALFKAGKPVPVVMRSMSADDELEALKLANGGGQRAQIEMVKLSLLKFNGKTVNHGDQEHEIIWEQLGPKGRNIVSFAFGKLWGADAEAVTKVQQTFRVGTTRA